MVILLNQFKDLELLSPNEYDRCKSSHSHDLYFRYSYSNCMPKLLCYCPSFRKGVYPFLIISK